MNALVVGAVAFLLAAAPKGPGQLTIEVKPSNSVVFVDGKKKGTGAKPIVVKLPAGKHQVRVTHKGDAHEEEVVVKAGEKKRWKWTFEGDEAEQPEKPAEGEKTEGEKPADGAQPSDSDLPTDSAPAQ